MSCTGFVASWSRNGAGTCTPGRPAPGRKTGSTGTASTGSAAPSAIRRQRNHVKKIIGKPYAGKPHVRIERGMGKPGQPTAPAPLTTNDQDRSDRPGAAVPADRGDHP